MNCPKCGFQNPADAKYCQKCANVFVSSNQSNQPEIEVMPEQKEEEKKYQGLTPSHEHVKKHKSKSFKIIIFILLGIIIIGGLVYAGYYYKDEIFGNKEKNEQELILGDWEKLILTQDELKRISTEEGLRGGASKIELEKDIADIFNNLLVDFKQIESVSDFNKLLDINIDDNYQMVGGFFKFFSYAIKSEFMDEDFMYPIMTSVVMEMRDIEEAEDYFKSVNDRVQSLKEQEPALFKKMDGIGEECFAFNIFSVNDNEIFLFRIKNYIGLVFGMISPNLEAGEIFVYEQANKIQRLLGEQRNRVDSDNDGLDDYDEMYIWDSDPNNSDTDSDGYLDGEEVDNGYNPLVNEKEEELNDNVDVEQDKLGDKPYEIDELDELLKDEPFKKVGHESWADDDTKAVKNDKSRISVLSGFVWGLDMYKHRNGNFPISKNEIILGEGSAVELCYEGFMSNCPGMAIKSMTNNLNTVYTYQSINGKDYKIEFELEEGFDEFKAGRHYATSEGIK